MNFKGGEKLLSSKSKRRIMIIISFVLLLSIPLIYKIYFKTFYYMFVVLLIMLQFPMEIFNWHDKLDERFYVKWRSGEDGFWKNFMWGALRSLVQMILLLIINLFFVYGFTPIHIVISLPSKALLIVSIILIIFSAIGGIIHWFESVKRYNRIYYNKNEKLSK